MPGQIDNQIFLSVDLKIALTTCQKAAQLTKVFRESNRQHINFSFKINLITNRLVFRFGRDTSRYDTSCFHQVDINLRPHEGGTLVYFVDTSLNIDYKDNTIDKFIKELIEALGQ